MISKLETKKLLLLCVVLIGSGISIFAQDSLRFTLEQAQAYALENGVNAKNAKLDIEAAKKTVWETTAIGLPQISGSIGYQYIPGDIPEADFGSFENLFGSIANMETTLDESPDFPGFEPVLLPTLEEMEGTEQDLAFAREQTLNYSVTLNQLVFSGEYIVGLQASRTFLELSKNQMEQTELDVKESVANSYFSIQTFEQSLVYLDSMAQNLESTLKEMRRMQEVGMAERTDVDQIELSLKNIENQRKSLERQRETMHMLFKIQLGMDMEQEIILTEPMILLIDKYDVDRIAQVDFELENNTNYKAMMTQKDIAALQLKQQKSMYLPSISAFYSYSDREYPGEAGEPSFDPVINHVIGVNVSVPIFSSGQRMARVSQAKIELEKTRNQLEQTEQTVQMQVDQAKFEVNNALDRYYTSKYSLELSQRILNNTLKKYKEGMVSSMDLSQANNQYLEAYTTYNQAVMELLSAKVRLNKLVNNL